MTFGELKALVANFEAVDDNMEIVTTDNVSGCLVKLSLGNVAVVGRDYKNRMTSITGCGAKVLHCHVLVD
jgi:hypothetical protein